MHFAPPYGAWQACVGHTCSSAGRGLLIRGPCYTIRLSFCFVMYTETIIRHLCTPRLLLHICQFAELRRLLGTCTTRLLLGTGEYIKMNEIKWFYKHANIVNTLCTTSSTYLPANGWKSEVMMSHWSQSSQVKKLRYKGKTAKGDWCKHEPLLGAGVQLDCG